MNKWYMVNLSLEMTPSMNIIMTHQNLPIHRVPFIVTYNPALPNIREILHKKQPIFDSTKRWHNIFSETPVVAFRRSPNLRDLLVRAKLKSPESNTLRHPPGTFRCNSRHGCLTCPINIDDGRTTYTFSTTGETREIKQHITCKSNNLTYMIECKKCKNNTLEKPNVAFANDSLNTGKLQIILITPALQQQYQRISTCLPTPSRTCYLSL